jgi:hypothetical protein
VQGHFCQTYSIFSLCSVFGQSKLNSDRLSILEYLNLCYFTRSATIGSSAVLFGKKSVSANDENYGSSMFAVLLLLDGDCEPLGQGVI